MKQRIFAVMAILAGAAGTATNIYLYRKAKEAEWVEKQNLLTASELYKRADIACEQSFLLQRDVADFAMLSDEDKEKVMAFARKLAKEEKDGPAISDVRQARDESEDEDEKLKAEYWRRVEMVYGRGKQSCGWAKTAKPVRSSETGYAYISVPDATKKPAFWQTISANVVRSAIRWRKCFFPTSRRAARSATLRRQSTRKCRKRK